MGGSRTVSQGGTDDVLSHQWHSGESHDFRTTTMADTSQPTVHSGKTFFDISVNTGQIAMGFEAVTPEK